MLAATTSPLPIGLHISSAGPPAAADTPGAGLRERLDAGLAALGLTADVPQRAALIAYLTLLARWNRAYNLTAVRDPLDMVARHLLDSLSVGPYLFGPSVLDLGTGPGLPGIPLALLHPHRRFWLLDSNGKKTRFVRQAVLELGLTNCEVVQARMESYRPGRKFATIVARALATLSELNALAEPLLERPGRLLLMKGRIPGAELDDLTDRTGTLGPNNPRIHRLEVPFLVGERHLIEVRLD
jgi:16S rRNA (guanine527-N7)-methyltransferase